MGLLDATGLSATTFAVHILVVAVLWFLISSFRSWHRLSHIPGPPLASLTSLWMGRELVRGQIAETTLRLQKYGHIVRVAPNYLLTDDPDVLRQVAAARSTYKRDEWWIGLRFNKDMDNMSTILEIEPHDKLKAKMAGAYAGRDGIDMETKVDEQIVHLKEVIRKRYSSGAGEVRTVDWAKVPYYFTLDVITYLAYGKEFGFLDSEGDLHDYTNSLDRFTIIGGLVTEMPWARACFTILGPLFQPRMTDKTGLGKVISIARDIIEDRFKTNTKDHGDMLSSFIRHGVTKNGAISEAALQLIAGAETSSTVIRSTMLHLMTTPRVYQQLKQEIHEAIRKGVASSSIIRVEESKKLPYLQAVVAEGIRMRPPAPYGHYKVVPPGGDTLGGIFVPGGTAIGHNSMALMRRKDIFGEDAAFFRPERFLEANETQRLEMDRTIDIHFGTGRWMCAGKSVAYTELYKIYFELLRDFDFQLANPGRPCKEESYILWKQTDMLVRISEQ